MLAALSLLPKRTGKFCMESHRSFVITVILFAMGAGIGRSQPMPLSAAGPISIALSPGQRQTLEIRGEANRLAVIEVRLEGGLVALQSPDAPKRLLDLGRGGRALFAVPISAEGIAALELSSAEQRREARVTVSDVTSNHTREEQEHLHVATVAFARADSARRHQAGAPDAITALREYDRAASEAEAAHDISFARWAMIQKARFLIYQQSTFVEARDLLLRAAALPLDRDEATLALTYKTLSTVDNFLGDLPAAAISAEQSLAFYRKTGDVYWQGIVLGNLISTYGDMGREAEAIAAGREALSDAEQTQDMAGVVFCLTELASLYREQGEYQRAFQAFRDALVWGENIHYAPDVEAEIEKELGVFYADMGLWEEAQAQLQLCLQHATADGPTSLGARGVLARVLEKNGNSGASLREYQTAISIAGKLQLQPEETMLRLEHSFALLRAGNIAAARADTSAAGKLAETLGIPALTIRAIIADASIEAQSCTVTAKASCDSAVQDYKRALSLTEKTGEREEEAVAYAGLARTYASRQDYDDALRMIERCLYIVEHSRASLASHSLAASFLAERRALYDLAIEISMKLALQHPNERYGETAFLYAERGRTRNMLDVISEEGEASGKPGPPDLRRRILANEHQIENQKALLLTKSGEKNAAIALRKLYLEQDALDAEARRQGIWSQQQKIVADADRIASTEDVQRLLLRPDTALIAFSLGTRQSYRWEITQRTVHVSILSSVAELRRSILPLQRLLIARSIKLHPGEDAAQYRSRRSAFDATRERGLVDAGRTLLPQLPQSVRHLYIVADGPLSSLPWNALRIPCGARRLCYAIERFAIASEPSASVAVQLTRHPLRTAGQNVLIVADPITQSGQPRWASFAPLPGTRREADAIARFIPTESLRIIHGEMATVDNVRALSKNLSILHFATHTFLVPGHPELSGIALSPERGKSEGKSILWVHDIPTLQAPSLVVLNGCSTQGQGLGGEELSALTQAFLYAGSHEVIGTIWSVDDEVAAVLMEHFYRELISRHRKAVDALRSAQLGMLKSGANLSDWAGFVIDGVPAETVNPQMIGRR